MSEAQAQALAAQQAQQAQQQAAQANQNTDITGVQPTPTPTPDPVPAQDTKAAPAADVKGLPSSYEDLDGASPLETAVNIFTAQTGVTEDTIAQAVLHAVEYGDPNLIDFRSVTEGLAPDQAAQAKALVKAVYQETIATGDRIRNEVYTLAGSREVWEETVQAFNTHAPLHVQQAARALEQQGNAKGAAQLVLETARSLGVVTNGTGIIQGSGGTTAPAALSPAEYAREFGKLQREAGNRLFTHPAYKAKYEELTSRRKAYRG